MYEIENVLKVDLVHDVGAMGNCNSIEKGHAEKYGKEERTNSGVDS